MIRAYQTPTSGIQQPVVRHQWLTIRIEDCHTAAVVHVTGEIDLCTAPILSTCLTTQLKNSNRRPMLVINLADVSFLSCAGLRVLLDTQHLATAHETALALVGCPLIVHRLLEVLNLRHQFQLYPSLTDALP
jgi:anti-anti-sigma factor